jgi:hypothetical protein
MYGDAKTQNPLQKNKTLHRTDEFILPPHKRLFWDCRHPEANPRATPKEPLLPNTLTKKFFLN